MGIFLTVLPLAVGGAAAVLTMNAMAQYSALPQPPLAPPAWVFPAVWTVLYLLMGAASRRVYRLGTQESRNALMLYYVQLAVHFVWPLLYFRAQEYAVAFWWLLLLLALVLAALSAFFRLDKAAGRMLMPYAAWLLFAAYLNYSMMRMA
nr:TspO/MBR family protein [uncultured Agathobaculum sp.]